MKKFGFIGLLLLALWGCSGDDYYSPHLDNPGLLPDRSDYLTDDYGTQELALEIWKVYRNYGEDSISIKMVMYDDQTRTVPLLTFTEKKWPVKINRIKDGSLEFGYQDFQTDMMPLKMTAKITMLLKLNNTQDTIFLRGTGGSIRTKAGDGQPIGTPLPQSDDAELEGYYVRSNKKLKVLLDPMLPIAMKAHITGN